MHEIGLFGGTFNPVHKGHVNSLKTVLKTFPDWEKIFVLPAHQSPHRSQVEGPSPQQRFEMVQLALEGFNGRLEVSDFEIEKGGISYTIETIEHFESQAEVINLIIGMDQFESFDHWKDFEKIMEKANLLVTSRPEAALPTKVDDIDSSVKDFVVAFEGNEALLASGKKIRFLQLDDVDASSTDIRQEVRAGEDVTHVVPKSVAEYIEKNQLYQSVAKKIGDFEAFTEFCGQLLFERKGIGVLGFDVRSITQPSEYVLIASGTSTRHTKTLADFVIKQVKNRYGVYPQNTEGLGEGRWVVLDYGSLIVHVFYDFTRQHYNLEELWKEGRDLKLRDKVMNNNE